MRDRDEHVEGLSEPHDVEVLLDRDRVQLFTVKPPQREAGVPDTEQPSHEKVDQHLKVRVPVTAGPHAVGVAFPKKPSVLLETPRQPYETHFNYYRHPRIQPAIYSVSILGPFGATGPGDTPSRRRIFGARSSSAEDDRAARQILAPLMRRAYRRPVTDADLQGPLGLYRIVSSKRRLRRGDRDGAVGRARESRVPASHRTGPRRHSAEHAVPRRRSRAGLPAVVLSLEQHSRRRAAARGCGGNPARARRARSAGPAHARRRAFEGARDQLRLAVAAAPEPGFDLTRHAALSGLRRQSPAGVPPGNGALLRQRPAGGSQRARSAQRQLHLPQRAAGQALRHSARLREPVPAGDARPGQLARRTAAPGQHPDRHLVRDADLAGAARQVRARCAARRASPAAASRRRGLEGQHGRRTAVGPRADRGAPPRPELRAVPQPHGSARAVAREVRRGRTPSNRRGRGADRRRRQPAGRPQVRGRRRARGGAAGAAGAVCRRLRGEARDLCAGTRGRVPTMRRRSARSCAARGRSSTRCPRSSWES